MQPLDPTENMKVDIQTVYTISCNDGKAIPVPASLLQEHGGRQWLKLRPTSQPISQIVFGKVDKNFSFSNHPGFQEFIAKRNHLWAKGDQSEEQVWEEGNENVPKPESKKRKLDEPEVVQVPLGVATIDCLMQGQRPTKSDVVLPLEASHLEPVFELLQQNPDQLKVRRPYQRKAQAEGGDQK